MIKISLLAACILFLVPAVCCAQPAGLPVLAVVSFENHSAVGLPDLENMGLQYLESALLSGGRFVLADRLSVQNSLTEIGFSSASGLVDPFYAINLGKMLGARYLVSGNVIDVSTRTTEFKGYGIQTRRTAVSVTVGIRVVDAERGTVLFIDQQSVSRENLPAEAFQARITEESYSTIQSLIQEALHGTVRNFYQRIDVLLPEAHQPARKVTISILSDPVGADVEVGGLFQCNTPCELELEEGRILEISVSLLGYQPWIKRVEVNPALRINALLAKAVNPAQTHSPENRGISTGNPEVTIKEESQ